MNNPWTVIEYSHGGKDELDSHQGFLFDLVPACRKTKATALERSNDYVKHDKVGCIFIAVPLPTNE
jgi:hypothetical protein